MGLSLVRNYSSAEEQTIKTCETILAICTNYIAEREQTDISLSELREGLYPFMDGLTDVYGRDSIRMYGRTFGGTAIVSNDPEIEAMPDYDVTGTPWYQGAAAANGETYLSPVYTHAATGLPVVTLCRMIPETGSFFAIDMEPSLFNLSSQDIDLPETASYFLADQEGNLLYCLSSWDYGDEEFQRFVDGCREGTVCNMADHVSENVKCADGVARSVYFHHMDNGWRTGTISSSSSSGACST